MIMKYPLVVPENYVKKYEAMCSRHTLEGNDFTQLMKDQNINHQTDEYWNEVQAMASRQQGELKRLHNRLRNVLVGYMDADKADKALEKVHWAYHKSYILANGYTEVQADRVINNLKNNQGMEFVLSLKVQVDEDGFDT